MAVGSGIRIEGFKALSDKLKLMPDKVRRKALRQATRAAANVVLKEAVARVPRSDRSTPRKDYKGNLIYAGHASRSIKAVVKVARNKRTAYARIGVKPSAFYALQFVELGNNQPAQEWLVPSFQSKVDEVLRIFYDKLKAAVEEAAK